MYKFPKLPLIYISYNYFDQIEIEINIYIPNIIFKNVLRHAKIIIKTVLMRVGTGWIKTNSSDTSTVSLEFSSWSQTPY